METQIIEITKFSDLPKTGSLNEAIHDYTGIAPGAGYHHISRHGDCGTVKIHGAFKSNGKYKLETRYFDYWKSGNQWSIHPAE